MTVVMVACFTLVRWVLSRHGLTQPWLTLPQFALVIISQVRTETSLGEVSFQLCVEGSFLHRIELTETKYDLKSFD